MIYKNLKKLIFNKLKINNNYNKNKINLKFIKKIKFFKIWPIKMIVMQIMIESIMRKIIMLMFNNKILVIIYEIYLIYFLFGI
jgi:hypothetical protein